MAVMSLQRTSCGCFAANRTLSVPRLALNSRRASVQVVAFRDDKVSSKVSKTANKLTSKAKQATKQGTSSKGGKQRAILGPKAPTTKKEEGESVVTFVAVASLFLTGVLFVVPALFSGSPVTTEPLQSGVTKSFGIKEPAGQSTAPSYAPGPSAAAAPGTAATR